MPTHITIHPPSDSRKRAVEKFAFTKVFEEEAAQLDIFKGTGVIPLVEGVLHEGRDGLLATLGVTGSGKVSLDSDCYDLKPSLTAPAEPYNSGIKIAARPHPALSGPTLSLTESPNPSPTTQSLLGFFAQRCRCLGSTDTDSDGLPGRCIWGCTA